MRTGRLLGRIGAVIGTVLLAVLIFLFSAVTVVFKGPSDGMKNLLVCTFMETSALKFIAQMYFTDEEIAHITDGNAQQIEAYLDTLSSVQVDISQYDGSQDGENGGITIEDVQGDTYCGKMMIVNDPSRISLYSIPQYDQYGEGESIQDMMKNAGAIAGFNGGGFWDVGGSGKGGMPLGIVIQNGKLLADTPTNYPTVVGFDFDNRLVVGNMTAQEALDAGVRDAVSFGPVLIKNGVLAPLSGSGGGLNPRTALGQRADGAVLILVIDGRQPHSLGATYKDVASVMERYGAVNAGNLDGGSSSMLFYKGEMVNSLSSAIGERKLPTAFIVT